MDFSRSEKLYESACLLTPSHAYEEKGEEDQMEIIQKLKTHSSVYHIPVLVLEGLQFTVGPYFLSHKFELKSVDMCVAS